MDTVVEGKDGPVESTRNAGEPTPMQDYSRVSNNLSTKREETLGGPFGGCGGIGCSRGSRR